MAVLLLAVFGYLLSAEADGGNLGRISRDWNGFVVRICQLQGELLLLPPSCCCPSKHNQRLAKGEGLHRSLEHQGGPDQLMATNQGNQTEGRKGAETKQGEKKGKGLAKMRVCCVSLLGEQECWEENQT